jgi:hypothetical protein
MLPRRLLGLSLSILYHIFRINQHLKNEKFYVFIIFKCYNIKDVISHGGKI